MQIRKKSPPLDRLIQIRQPFGWTNYYRKRQPTHTRCHNSTGRADAGCVSAPTGHLPGTPGHAHSLRWAVSPAPTFSLPWRPRSVLQASGIPFNKYRCFLPRLSTPHPPTSSAPPLTQVPTSILLLPPILLPQGPQEGWVWNESLLYL